MCVEQSSHIGPKVKKTTMRMLVKGWHCCLNVTDCKDESEEDLEIMVKSCYLLLQVEKLKPVMVGLKLEFA